MTRETRKSAFLRQFAVAVVAVLSITLAACAVHLAPAYEDSIEKDTIELHKRVETFLESASTVQPGVRHYEQHTAFYIDTLATLQNLRLRADARSVSPPRWLAGLPAASVSAVNESAAIFGKLIEAFGKLRSLDKRTGLNSENVPELRVSFDELFAASLEYENALKR